MKYVAVFIAAMVWSVEPMVMESRIESSTSSSYEKLGSAPGVIKRVKRGLVPTIAIIGRPNVGKSTLTNRLCDAGNAKGAIVYDVPGVTRDRVYQRAEWQGRVFDVVDTGGLLVDDEDGLFAEEIREQAAIALRESCAAVVVVDGRQGRMSLDEDIARFLRRRKYFTEKKGKGVETILAVNKCENPATEASNAAEFWSLGLGEPMACSAVHGNGVAEVLDALLPAIDKDWEQRRQGGVEVVEEEKEEIDVALLGRPNVGKSSLLNRFLGQQRAIVSEKAGTTRDAVDEAITVDATLFRFVDTAGVRRKARVNRKSDSPEEKMVGRALRAVKRSDVVLLVVDSTAEKPTDQDCALAQRIKQDGRACVVIANKWDIKEEKDEKSTRQVSTIIKDTLSDVNWADILFVSALTGQRCLKVYQAIQAAVQNHRKRVPTAVLNDIIRDAMLWQPPPATAAGSNAGKIYFVSQTAIAPPTIVAICNDPRLFTDNYKRYLERKLRESLDWTGTPIRFVFRGKRLRDEVRDSNKRKNLAPKKSGSQGM